MPVAISPALGSWVVVRECWCRPEPTAVPDRSRTHLPRQGKSSSRRRVAAVHAGCVVAADGAGRRGGGDRQVDGELLDIEAGTDEAAPFGSAEQFERKHQEAPGAFFREDDMPRGYPYYDRTPPRVRESR